MKTGIELIAEERQRQTFKKIKTIGSIVFYFDENGVKRMATKERFKEIQKERL